MRISNIFIVLNLLVLALLLFVDARGSIVEYSMLQCCILIISQILLAILNKRIRNKLLDLLILHILIFYTLRIPFLFTEHILSDVISRNVDLFKIEKSLAILNIQILIFSLIIIIFKPLNNLFISISNFKPNTNSTVVL